VTDGSTTLQQSGHERLVLCEVHFAQAWNLRGDPAQTAFVEQAATVFGLPLPTRANSSAVGAGRGLLSLGPKSWLWIADGPSGTFDDARQALNAAGGALFDVSASYVMWRMSGTAAPTVLNRACPLDLHPATFLAGTCAQSLLGHIGATFYRPAEEAAFVVMVARSFAPDAWAQMREAGRSDACVIGAPMAFGELAR